MFPNARKRSYRVATLGFSEFERSALTSFFRLAQRRVPSYVQVDSPDESDFLIADADQARVIADIVREGRIGQTVFVGAQAPQDALAWLTRPIEPIHIVQALDGLLGGQQGRDPAPVDPGFESPTESGDGGTASSAEDTTPPEHAPRATSIVRGGGDRPVLVVDDSAIARTFLAQRLRGLGYRVTLAPDGEEALEVSSQTAFAIIFLDIELGSGQRLDGLQVCQRIKQRATHPQGLAPAVVITTGRSGATDRVRGSFAGCDAYLTKPLLQAEFNAALRQVDPLFGRALPG